MTVYLQAMLYFYVSDESYNLEYKNEDGQLVSLGIAF